MTCVVRQRGNGCGVGGAEMVREFRSRTVLQGKLYEYASHLNMVNLRYWMVKFNTSVVACCFEFEVIHAC
jgi:hypothetical protein